MSGHQPNRGRRESTIPFHPRGRGRGAIPQDQQPRRGGGRGGSGRGTLGSARGSAQQIVVFRPENQIPIENNKVKTTEQKIIKSLKANSTIQLPLRPGFGTKGTEILLWTNYFELTGYGKLLVHRYSIIIAPDRNGHEPRPKKRRHIIELLLKDYFDSNNDVVTDFKSNIITKSELSLQNPYNVTYRDDESIEPQQNAPVYAVTINQTGVLSTSDLLDYVTSTDSNVLLSSKDELIQALNVIIGYHPKAASHVASVGANKHYDITSKAAKIDLGSGLQAIRGFLVSVRAATSRVLVNIQIKHGSFYQEGPLEGLMNVFLQENGLNKIKLESFLKGISVRVNHIQRKNRSGRLIPRIKQISALATRNDGQQLLKPPIVPNYGSGPKEVKFFLSTSSTSSKKKEQRSEENTTPSGNYITVYDFFKQTYNINISDTRLPVINVGTKQNPSYLPAQVCDVESGQHSSTKLSPSQTQSMIRFAVRKPDQNARSIVTSGAVLVGFEPTNATLKRQFGLQIKPELLTVPGRVLNHPSIRYHGSDIVTARYGSWNLQNIKFSTTTDLPYWTYLALAMDGRAEPWRTNQDLQACLAAFTRKLNEVGITTTTLTQGMTVSLQPSSIESQIDNAIHLFMHSTKRKPPKFLLIILPTRDTRIYNRVKYVCDIKEGVLNVCTVASKFVKPSNDQYFANIALKVNLKLGGRNHTLENEKLGIVAEGKTMIVGLDVTHPSPGSAKAAPSVGGIVASIDRWLGQWPAELIILPPRQEMITGLQSLIKTRLKLWKRHNKALPDNILVYRDGVSEGQYNLVIEKELPAFRHACKDLYAAERTKNGFPHITIIIVGKRHNTRFYPTRIDDADRSSNPPNGTVVDRGVTEARNWDFFLQAHAALQGTARPAHYYVILDEIFRHHQVKKPFMNTADVLEDLTHNLCYLFGRATKAVSICPPAYYADLVCERARCYLSGLFDPESAETSSTGTTSTSTPDSSSVKLHRNVEHSMFYI